MIKIVNGIKYEAIISPATKDVESWRALTNLTNKNRFLAIPEEIDNKPVTAILTGCFMNNTNLQGIELPDSIKTIDKMAFAKCKNLEWVHVAPSKYTSVVVLKAKAFYGCNKLKEVLFNRPCKLQGADIFTDCFLLEKIGKDNRVYGYIDVNCFRNCKSLEMLHIASEQLRIFSDAFGGCVNLHTLKFDSKEVSMPKTIKKLLMKKKIYCNANCNLVELAYEGANIHIMEEEV